MLWIEGVFSGALRLRQEKGCLDWVNVLFGRSIPWNVKIQAVEGLP